MLRTSAVAVELNFVRKHALAFQAEHGGTMEDAALRVFGNADGAYGANVNNLVGSGMWNNEDELADAYLKRKGFAYGVNAAPSRHEVPKNVPKPRSTITESTIAAATRRMS